MDIRLAKQNDIDQITKLVSQVSVADVLPHFDSSGQQEYMRRVIPDIETTLNTVLFDTFVAVEGNLIVGFAAIREKNYITHLFVAKEVQGQGLGKILLEKMLAQTSARQISLRSSINAQHFYKKQGFSATEPEDQFCGIRFIPMAIDTRKSKR
ncbi:GNAT family N-acetyltransferase [Pseudoalteromonas luteoviolacea]|uniref:GNAT family N-acetyltransferase n=1 Tax=Pseudoalteromonas luteoviolacea TaxID=43657 RepID=UPI001152F721|nr:GNAT family N-acetyltransferase [Pseudoalteromonas luteoviolacea]TQF67348.1 GNAT family N-acetyltransferase [Pseudoalteromonas luteoviolacea]